MRKLEAVVALTLVFVGACVGDSDETVPAAMGTPSFDGGLPDGDLHDGDLHDGDLPDGYLPDGYLPDGDLHDGDLPDGNLPDGNAPQTCSTTADCQDGNACTEDRCVNGSCLYPPLADGIPCTGSVDCTSRGRCHGGGCELGPAATLLDVRERGAVGDGATDDRPVIQDAIDEASQTGATVYLPAGTYAVTPSAYNMGLRLASDVAICGEGPDSVIKLLGGTDGTRAVSGTKLSNVVLRDFAVDGNANAATVEEYGEQRHNVFISASEFVLIQRMTVTQSLGDGIFLYGSTHDSVVEGCYAYAGASDNPRVGINVQGASHVLVRNNAVDTYDTSYKAELDSGDPDSIGVVLIGNSAIGLHPLALNGKHPTGRCIDYVIEGNTFEGANEWALWVGHAINTTIRYNTFLGGGSGVYLIFDSQNLIVEDNRFEAQSVGIQLSNYQDMGASAGVDILRNEFVDVATVVNVSAPITDVEVAHNQYPANATLIKNPERVTGLSEHDNTPVP